MFLKIGKETAPLLLASLGARICTVVEQIRHMLRNAIVDGEPSFFDGWQRDVEVPRQCYVGLKSIGDPA